MYNQRIQFRFCEPLASSERFRFLSDVAERLNKAGPHSEESPGFSIAVGTDGETTVDVWQPGKWEALFAVVCAGEEHNLLRITSPKQFAEWRKSRRMGDI